MSKNKKEKINPIASFEGSTIDLTKFNLKTDKEQQEIIENELKKIYKDNLKVTKKHILKVIRLTYNPKDDYTYLPHDLKVSKNKLNLQFEVSKKKVGTGLIIFLIWLLLFAIIGATYLGFRYLSIATLNKDIDGDGIADLNVDTNDDKKADVNIDTVGDNKPNLNIDYKGRRIAIFNIDKNNEKKPTLNFVNDANSDEKLKECVINCDTNGDGWPDTNLDLNADGIRDTDIDVDKDGVPDLNLDVNGDGVCDVFCDDDGDEVCDRQCTYDPYDAIKHSGSSKQNGDPSVEDGSAMLIIEFLEGETYSVDGILPTDQGVPSPIPYKKFSVRNLSPYTLNYNLKFEEIVNTFISENFEYMVESTNNGYSAPFRPAPRGDNGTTTSLISSGIPIAGNTTQEYTITFRLKGINANQNYDKGRTYSMKVLVDTDE